MLPSLSVSFYVNCKMTKRRPWFIDYDSGTDDRRVYVYYIDKDGSSKRLLKRKSADVHGAIIKLDIIPQSYAMIQIQFEGAQSVYCLNCTSFNFTKSMLSENFEHYMHEARKFVDCFERLRQNGDIIIPDHLTNAIQLSDALDSSSNSDQTSLSDVSSCRSSRRLIHDQVEDSNMTKKPKTIVSEDMLRTESDTSFIGFYVLKIENLLVGKQSYRKLDAVRVEDLAYEFLHKYNDFYQPVCVMVKDCPDERFIHATDDSKKLENQTFIVLGGQHNVAACKKVMDMIKNNSELGKLLSAGSLSSLQNRRCMVYAALSPNAQLFLSKEHQRIQTNSMDINFQDQIRLARQLRTFPGANSKDCWKELCINYLRKDGKKDGCEEVQSVIKLASLEQDAYDELLINFSMYEKYKLLGQKTTKVPKSNPRLPWTFFRGILSLDSNSIREVLIDVRTKNISLKDLSTRWKKASRMKFIHDRIGSILKCDFEVAKVKFGKDLGEEILEKILCSLPSDASQKDLDFAVQRYLATMMKGYGTVVNDCDLTFTRSRGKNTCRFILEPDMKNSMGKSWFKGFDLIVFDYSANSDRESIVASYKSRIEDVVELNTSAQKSNYFILSFVNTATFLEAEAIIKSHSQDSRIIFFRYEKNDYHSSAVVPYYNDVMIAIVSFFGVNGHRVPTKSNFIAQPSFSMVCDELIADLTREEQDVLSFIDSDAVFNRSTLSIGRNLTIICRERNLNLIVGTISDLFSDDVVEQGSIEQIPPENSVYDFDES